MWLILLEHCLVSFIIKSGRSFGRGSGSSSAQRSVDWGCNNRLDTLA